MLQTFQDHYRDAVASGEQSAAHFWYGVIADEMQAIPRAQLAAVQETWRRWTTATSAAHGREEPLTMTLLRARQVRYWLLSLLLLLLTPVAATI
jgi:hypothetical protein